MHMDVEQAAEQASCCLRITPISNSDLISNFKIKTKLFSLRLTGLCPFEGLGSVWGGKLVSWLCITCVSMFSLYMAKHR